MHLDDGTLRRSIDEPAAMDGSERVHLDGCAECRERLDAISRDASFAQTFLTQPVPAFDARSAAPRATRARRRPAWLTSAVALAAAACVAFALAFTPLGGVAAQWLTIFEPKQFAPLQISAADSEELRLVPSLERLGTFVAPKPPPDRRVKSLAGIGGALGFEPRAFDTATAGQPGPMFVLKPSSESFTFSAAKARAYEAAFHRSLLPMPAGLDGATYTATYGPALVRTFGKDGDRVTFVEMKAPRVVSTGANLETAANYILSLPNVPARVAAQLRSLADPMHTLPVPIDFDKQTSTPVSVDGVTGLAIGDESRFGAGVVWSKDGIVYVVAGPIKESEAIALARAVK